MMPMDPARLEFDRLLSQLVDGTLSPDEEQLLQDLIVGQPELRDAYIRYLALAADLHEEAARSVQAGGESTEPDLPAPVIVTGRWGRFGRKLVRHWKYAAAVLATLAVSYGVQQTLRPLPVGRDWARDARPVEYVATLASELDSKWKSHGWGLGARLSPGLIELQQGAIEIVFDSGSVLVMEGPATLRIESRTRATLLTGKVVFQNDETADAFELNTPTSALHDLGTEYAVRVEPDSEEVHVFAGEVTRVAKSDAKSDLNASGELLTTGQARRFRTAAAQGDNLVLATDRFVREIPSAPAPATANSPEQLASDDFDEAVDSVSPGGQGKGWAGPWELRPKSPMGQAPDWKAFHDARHSLSLHPEATLPSGGHLAQAAQVQLHRRLEHPLRLDQDGVYFVSLLFQATGVSAEPPNALVITLRNSADFAHPNPKLRAQVAVAAAKNLLWTQLAGQGARTPVPLSSDTTYLLVGKLVASRDLPDQLLFRVFRSGEPIPQREPGNWTVVGPTVNSKATYDTLTIAMNGHGQYLWQVDDVRIGTSWAAATSRWWDAANSAEPAPADDADPAAK